MSIQVENPLIAAALAQRLAVSRFLQRDNEQGGQSVDSGQSAASEGQSIASEGQNVASEGQNVASEEQSIVASEEQSVASEEQSVASEEQSVASKPQRSKVVMAKRKTTLQHQLLSLISMMSPGHTFGASELVSTTNADYAFKTLCEEGWIKRIGAVDSRSFGARLQARL